MLNLQRVVSGLIPLLFAFAAFSAPRYAHAQAAAPAAAPEPPATAEEDDPDPWPRVLTGEKATMRLHPPQVDSWNGRKLEAHCAVEVIEKGTENPLYGVVEFEARTKVDKETRLAVVDEIEVVRATFPSHPDRAKNLVAFLQAKFSASVKVISLDRLESALAASDSKPASGSLPVENRAPKFFFAERPTMLVTVDGAPVWQKIGDSGFERLINTRPVLLQRANSYYLHLFDGWLAAPNLAGPWNVANGLPPGIGAALDATMKTQPGDLLDGGGGKEVDEAGQPIAKPTLAKGPVPEIVVATEPTELIVFEGAAQWTAIPGTALEFVENSSGNLFRKGEKPTYFVLASGRWFESKSLAGPWEHVPQARLDGDFRSIPDDSPKENVKASVAGTQQAAEAVIANSIPETSEIRRKEAKFLPTIDGKPSWKPVAGTPLEYVENSSDPILRAADGAHYALHRAVWFEAPMLSGPWTVATSVPAAIYAIPTSNPLHYVTYVRIYNETPDVVVVGYTPGYYGTVVADEVVVYGTGYSYAPWIGTSWYGYPMTYGYGSAVTYTPWGGWAYGYGIGWGWGYWGGWYAPYYPPYWGPYGYYYGWYGGYYGWYGGVAVGSGGGWAAWGPGGWAGTTGNIYRQWGNTSSVARAAGGYNAWTGNAWRAQSGVAYNSRTGGIAAGQRGAVGNIYTGEYAYGGRGAARTGSGNVVAGGRVTAGDVDTGRQVTAGRVGGYNPNTGQSGSAGWVRGDEGGVARVGDDVYAGKDGNVYKRDGAGDWSQVDRSGQWKGVDDRARTSDLNRQWQGRSSGSNRYSGSRYGGRAYGGARGGGGRRR